MTNDKQKGYDRDYSVDCDFNRGDVSSGVETHVELERWDNDCDVGS